MNGNFWVEIGVRTLVFLTGMLIVSRIYLFVEHIKTKNQMSYEASKFTKMVHSDGSIIYYNKALLTTNYCKKLKELGWIFPEQDL